MFKHDFPFDPTYGHDEQALRRIAPPEPPADFAEFWRKTYDAARAVPLNITTRPSAFTNKQWDVSEVEFDGLDGFRCGAWLAVPKGRAFSRGVVVSHGYGGRSEPELWQPGPLAAGIFPCARGFNLSARPDLPSGSNQHVIHGIDRRETYIHRGCIADLWSALSALLALVPHVEGRVDFVGGSFGGGIGALALPWEKRFRKAHLSVPSFGHHPLRLSMPCCGSGELVRQYVAKNPRIATDVLPTFDAAIAAGLITAPTIVSAALFDPAVPPPGQWAVANAASRHGKIHVLESGHFDWPGAPMMYEKLNDAVSAWFE